MSPGARSRGKLLAVRWSDLAERDLGAVYEYLVECSPQATRTVIEGLLAAVRRLRAFPLLGVRAQQLEPEGDLRHLPWRHYVVFYRPHADHIAVLRIWDAHRDPASLRIPQDPPPLEDLSGGDLRREKE